MLTIAQRSVIDGVSAQVEQCTLHCGIPILAIIMRYISLHCMRMAAGVVLEASSLAHNHHSFSIRAVLFEVSSAFWDPLHISAWSRAAKRQG